MPILSKKKAAAAGVAHNNRSPETKRANAEMRMKKERKNTAKALKMFKSGPSKANIDQNKRAAATEHNYKTLHNGGTRKRRASSRRHG